MGRLRKALDVFETALGPSIEAGAKRRTIWTKPKGSKQGKWRQQTQEEADLEDQWTRNWMRDAAADPSGLKPHDMDPDLLRRLRALARVSVVAAPVAVVGSYGMREGQKNRKRK